MPTAEAAAPVVPPLSILTESEREIAENVHQFAAETIGPRSLAMDLANRMDPELVRQFFELDLMGIEIPEEFGGLGQNFTTSIAVIEAIARVDAACAVCVDVQNTL
ncbi:MAG TPA: acyl-CoA dehydrogenase family protein, partial [Thermoanaerobaculia bacterium]|nr:acyl-CoA dehydrogenase family protein [Thermoanaerobaculia bacterium]